MAEIKDSNAKGLRKLQPDSATDGGCVDNVTDSLAGLSTVQPTTSAQPRIGQPGVLLNIIPQVYYTQGTLGCRPGSNVSVARRPTVANTPQIIPRPSVPGGNRMVGPYVFPLTNPVPDGAVGPRIPRETTVPYPPPIRTPHQSPNPYTLMNLSVAATAQQATSAGIAGSITADNVPRMEAPCAIRSIIPTSGARPQPITDVNWYLGEPIVIRSTQEAERLGLAGGNVMVWPTQMPLMTQALFGTIGPRPLIGIPVPYPPVIRGVYQAVGTPYYPLNPLIPAIQQPTIPAVGTSYPLNTSNTVVKRPTTHTAVPQTTPVNIGGDIKLAIAAGNNLGKLSLEFNKKSRIFAIRAKGKDDIRTTIYNVINFHDRRVSGTLVVDEHTENVQLKDSDGLHVMTANGGLFSPNCAMHISWPTNEPLAVIEATGIHVLTNLLAFTFGTRCMGRRVAITIINHRNRVLASIAEDKDVIKISLTKKTLEHHISLILLLYALKLIHTQFHLHMLPMPFGILSNIYRSAYRQLPPSLDILHHLGNIRLRLCSFTKFRHFFVDIIDKISGRILLIAAVKGNNVEFNDPCGTTHFIGHFGKGVVLRVTSPPPENKVYGRIVSDNRVWNPEGVELMTISDPQSQMSSEALGNPGNLLIYSPDRSKKYAEVAPDGYTVSIDMGIPLSPLVKALILVRALRTAIFRYKINQQTSPIVDDYSYAKVG